MPSPEQTTPAYAPPIVRDLGSLAEMTQACYGVGSLDEGFKGDDADYGFSSPFFGDAGLCEAP